MNSTINEKLYDENNSLQWIIPLGLVCGCSSLVAIFFFFDWISKVRLLKKMKNIPSENHSPYVNNPLNQVNGQTIGDSLVPEVQMSNINELPSYNFALTLPNISQRKSSLPDYEESNKQSVLI
jgi:hypothetical protein